MMSIYHNEPATWQDLQTRVAKILSDLEFETEIEKNTELMPSWLEIVVDKVELLGYPLRKYADFSTPRLSDHFFTFYN